MRYIAFSIAISLLTLGKGYSQSAGEEISNKIAQRMKDSLGLTTDQKSQVYNVNIQLHSQKMLARQQNENVDSLTVRFQRIENTRDSLYRPILTTEQFLLYVDKKKNLVNNN